MRQHLILKVGLLVALGAALSCGHADESKNSFDSEPLIQWLWESDDPVHQAVAMTIAPPDHFSTGEIESRLRALVQAANSPTMVGLLTMTCNQRNALNTCIDAGLEQAIIQLADGNLLLRGTLFPSDFDWERAIRETPVARDPSLEIAGILNQAFQDYIALTGRRENESLLGFHAIAHAMATSVPYNGLYEACAELDNALAEPCLNIQSQLQQPDNTLIARNIGFAMERDHLIRSGDIVLAEGVEYERIQIWERMRCITYALPENHASQLTRSQMQRWFELATTTGEMAAIEFLGEQFGVECAPESRETATAAAQ